MPYRITIKPAHLEDAVPGYVAGILETDTAVLMVVTPESTEARRYDTFAAAHKDAVLVRTSTDGTAWSVAIKSV